MTDTPPATHRPQKRSPWPRIGLLVLTLALLLSGVGAFLQVQQAIASDASSKRIQALQERISRLQSRLDRVDRQIATALDPAILFSLARERNLKLEPVRENQIVRRHAPRETLPFRERHDYSDGPAEPFNRVIDLALIDAAKGDFR